MKYSAMNRIAGLSLLPLMLVAGFAQAQQAQAPAARAQASQAAPQVMRIQPGALLDAAQRAAMVVDAGQVAQLWNDASSVAKRTVSRDDFVAGIAGLRKPLGTLVGREWLTVRRTMSDGNTAVPAGLYGSVEFAATYAGNRTVLELVTFRLDEDGVWRLSGYTLQP